MQKTIRILLVDDDPTDRALVTRTLTKGLDDVIIEEADCREHLTTVLNAGVPDVVITDYLLRGLTGLEVIELVRGQSLDTPIVMLTGTGTEEIAIEAMKRGVADYVIKSLTHIKRLPAVVEHVLARADTERAAKHAEEQIAASLKEKEVLLREIHHRVKNNMQIITSLLRIQTKKITNKAALRVFKECQIRIAAMALIHETLYRSKSFSRIDFDKYTRKLCKNLSRAYSSNAGSRRIIVDICNVSLSIDKAVPVALIITELVSNAFKHAFGEREQGKIRIHMHADDEIELVIGDDGVGFPQEIDLGTVETLGLSLVKAMVADQLGGSIQVIREAGTEFIIKFKDKNSNRSFRGRTYHEFYKDNDRRG